MGQVQSIRSVHTGNDHSRNSRIRDCVCYLGIVFCLISCGTIKKGSLLAAATATTAVVASAFSGAVVVPAAVGATAFVTSVTADLTMDTRMRGIDMECAPDTIWTVAEKAVELGGIGLILAFVVVPVIAGWLIPGPTKLNRK